MFQEIGGKYGLGEHKERTFMVPSGHTNALTSSHSSREDILPKGKQYKELQGKQKNVSVLQEIS